MSQVTTRPRCRFRRLAHLGMRQPQHMNQASMLTCGSTEWMTASRRPPRPEHVAFEAIDTRASTVAHLSF